MVKLAKEFKSYHLISKEARKYVAKEIKNYHHTKKELKELEEGIAYSNSVGDSVISFGNHKQLQQMRNFIESFEFVYNQLSEERQRMVHLLYWSNRIYNCDGVGMQIGVDGSTVGRWRSAILSDIANRMGMK